MGMPLYVIVLATLLFASTTTMSALLLPVPMLTGSVIWYGLDDTAPDVVHVLSNWMLPPDVPVVVIAVPSNFTVIAEFAAKLLPVTVTDVPVGPLVGFSVIVATGVVVTVNVAEAKLDPELLALTV